MAPADSALADWEAQRPLWEELLNRPLPDIAALRQWIQDWSELSDGVVEIESRLSIERSCDTQSTGKLAAYLAFVERVKPPLALATDAMNRRLIAHSETAALPADHGQWLHSVRTEIELFHEKNIPLHTELSRLAQEYDQIQGAMTVEWEGETRNLNWMDSLLQQPDRAVRERAWRLIAGRRLQDADRLDALFDRMVALRGQVAVNLGLPDFVSYAFKKSLRADYSRSDCFLFHDAATQAGVPVYREALEARRRTLGLERLRPWDLDCDPEGRPPLEPFQAVAQLVEKTARIFARLDPELAAQFGILQGNPLMDLDNRVGKAPGGYQTVLTKARLPFIFMNTAGINKDVFTLLHESGHAFHYFLARHHPLPFNRNASKEFAEVASMSMERLGADHLDEFYSPEDRRRAVRLQAEVVFRLIPWTAAIDAFQHWIYTTPHTAAERRVQWLQLDDRFGSAVDWSGLEAFRCHAWQRQLHIYKAPFYYIEYAIAQIGALQVWQRSIGNPAEALRLYKHALSLGRTLGLKDLFAAAGLQFGMDEATLRPLLEQVREEWRASL